MNDHMHSGKLHDTWAGPTFVEGAKGIRIQSRFAAGSDRRLRATLSTSLASPGQGLTGEKGEASSSLNAEFITTSRESH